MLFPLGGSSSDPIERAGQVGAHQAQPKTTRYICLDFETNGFPTRGAERRDWPLPFSSFPTQISVDIVEGGEVSHAFDTYIRGATSLAP